VIVLFVQSRFIMNLSVLKPEAIVNEVFAMYEKYGKRSSAGESDSQLDQVTQAAALAEEEGFEDEVILAAFFHDIGCLYTSNTPGNLNQERLGAEYLREHGFSERLAALVGSDVMTKRYLAFKSPEYYDHLSADEKRELDVQGGPLTKEQAANFELDPDAELFVRLRYLNDKAKEVKRPYRRDLSHLKLLATTHLYKIIDQYLPPFLMPKTIAKPTI